MNNEFSRSDDEKSCNGGPQDPLGKGAPLGKKLIEAFTGKIPQRVIRHVS